MIPLAGRPVLTAAEMRAAEAAVIARGDTVKTLMARAGTAVAEQVRRLASGGDVLVLCGPGNNGGDGYVAASALATAGCAVRVAANGPPRGTEAQAARRGWSGAVEVLGEAAPATVVVDALFGTGLSRPLDAATAAALARLVDAARLAIAIDLPSGVGTDDGALLGDVPAFDVTLALGAAKPAHVLQPAAARCGALRILDIGVAAASEARVLARPELAAPGPQDHKYTRGMVAIVAGAMPGATALAATAAAHAGAGYVLLLGSATDRLPHAVVRRRYDAALLDDDRIGALLIGPGLGRDDRARAKLDDALASSRALVIDGDALHLVDVTRLASRTAPAILTPHDGEFAALFGEGEGSKLDRARAAARASGATIVFKGADTVIARADGQARIAARITNWLSTAGTGDTLAGIVAAQLAATGDAFAAATAGVWLHTDAARRGGSAFIADDLAAQLPAAIAACL